MENTQTLIRTRDEGREHTREMLIDDKVVCWLGVIDFTMRIGAGTARMAGIAGVETRHEHRKKGYMRILFADTVTYMQQQGYDVTMLYGIPDFYTKFGYAVCLSTPSLKLQTRDAELARSIAQPITTAPTTPADWPAIIDLFNQRNAARTCSMARAADTFKGFQKGSYWDVRAESVAIRDSHDRIAGYVVWDQNAEAVHVVELEVADEALYPALLAMLAQEAVKKRCGDITFHLPLDHPFGEFAQRYGCEWSVRHFRHANGMGRILNQASLFDKLMPTLRTRVAQSPMRDHSFALILRTDLGETTLMFGAPGEQPGGVLDLSQDRLMQLVLGYRSARDVLNDPAVQAQSTHPNFREWLDVLFPRGYPHNWLPDYF